MHQSFRIGFEKVSSLANDHSTNAAQDALVGILPLGTTISTAFGDRPPEHSRALEWASRVGGAGLGGALGSSIGRMARNPHLMYGLGLGGAVGGEYLGSLIGTSDLYDKYTGEPKQQPKRR